MLSSCFCLKTLFQGRVERRRRSDFDRLLPPKRRNVKAFYGAAPNHGEGPAARKGPSRGQAFVVRGTDLHPGHFESPPETEPAH